MSLHRPRLLGATILCLSAALCACAARASGPSVELKGQHFGIEIAADDASRERGLMFRDSMPADHGMLFVFDRPEVQQFWMKNTHIPLDILYFDQNYRLVSMSQRTPPCHSMGNDCPVYPSSGPAQYVLELNAGTADKLGVTAGDELKVTR
ncbi:MAG: DUF192 domain-containing protein [Rudaea sp.]|nr:DUF192 domain-containing protein [Rudaea sp.]